MPKIQWERLPGERWAHLRDRAKERQFSEEDLFELAEWKRQDPDVPDGDRYEDFGTFKTPWQRQVSQHVSPCRPAGAGKELVKRLAERPYGNLR